MIQTQTRLVNEGNFGKVKQSEAKSGEAGRMDVLLIKLHFTWDDFLLKRPIHRVR